MQHYFTTDNTTGEYVYFENGIKYSLPLLLMLKFKKFIRENNFSHDDLYISRWYLSLDNEDLEKVSLSLDKGYEAGNYAML